MRNRNSVLGALVRRLSRLSWDRRGNLSVMFAFAVIPVSVMGLAAIDFNRASAVRHQLQDALDAATLAAARSTATTQAAITTVGTNALKANLSVFPDVTLTSSSFTLNADGTVSSEAKAKVTTLVADAFIGSDLTVAARNAAKRANNLIELALVLDNTGSMAGSKLTNTITAAKSLVDTLAAAAARSTTPDAVKISLVPFSITVRLSNTFKGQAWMDPNGISPINNQIFTTTNNTTFQSANRWTLFQNMNLTWAGCVESRQYPYDVKDTGPTAATPATLFTPYFAPDEPDKADYPNDTTWKGYSYNNDYIDDGYTANDNNFKNWWLRQGSTTKYKTQGLSTSGGKGPNQGCTMQTVMRLTTDYAALKTQIGGMVATGNTNIPMGLVWGWHTLSPNLPFADGRAYGTDKLKKIVVLMTDGDNVMSNVSNPNASSYNGLGYVWQGRLGITSGTDSQRAAIMDSRLQELCTNMKAQNIEIYTIGVGVTTAAATRLTNCATDATHYFNVTDATQLAAVFDTIAGTIANLHLSS